MVAFVTPMKYIVAAATRAIHEYLEHIPNSSGDSGFKVSFTAFSL